MPAQLNIYKYTGKDGCFGTPVTGVGIKRIDSVVPAVYQDISSGGQVVPSDDTTDANTYPVYRPDDPSETAFSYESVFKLVLKSPPSNQLSHIRIYPKTDKPSDTNIPTLYIGNTVSYHRPTNTQSLIATNSIWNYTAESPFLLTVNGNVGQYVVESLSTYVYNITQHDIGFGNKMYLNNVRQIDLPIATNNTFSFIDKTNGAMVFTVFDPATDLPITHTDITVSTSGLGERIVEINATTALLLAYPNGFKYGTLTDSTVGYTITWVDLTASPILTEEYTVDLRTYDYDGNMCYFFNGERNPILNFVINKRYRFINLAGATDPLRFINSGSIIANNEDEIILNGITVTNGGTANEIVDVDPTLVKQYGNIILGYQSVNNIGYGNEVTNTRVAMVGNYNMNTVGAGIINPLASGETDYVYLQLKVTGNSTVGQTVPELVIEYDES